jgi:uncharacterized repeat protein (TIGR03803 family)
MYGTTYLGGSQGSGTVYELQPSNGGWTAAELHGFTGDGGPLGSVAFDAAGNLYGTSETTTGLGVVFKLTPSQGGWNYAELHDFAGQSDGFFPFGNVVIGADGTLYGTASHGGTNSVGVVWEITP